MRHASAPCFSSGLRILWPAKRKRGKKGKILGGKGGKRKKGIVYYADPRILVF